MMMKNLDCLELAQKTQVNLSSAIKLTREYRVSSRRKRNFKKAMKSGLSIGHGMRFGCLLEILEQNLKSKFGSRQHIPLRNL